LPEPEECVSFFANTFGVDATNRIRMVFPMAYGMTYKLIQIAVSVKTVMTETGLYMVHLLSGSKHFLARLL
jgi:hypothetical protein